MESIDLVFIVIINLVFLIGTIVCLYHFNIYRKKVSDIKKTPTSKIGNLLNEKRNKGIPVEVKGFVTSDTNCLAPLSKSECIFYHSIEKDKIEKKSSSNCQSRTLISYDTTLDIYGNAPFYIEDETGKISVDPQGFEFDGRIVMNKEYPVAGAGSGFSLFEGKSNNRIIGQVRKEEILVSGQKAYIIGELFVGAQGSFIGSDITKKKTNLISIQSESKLIEKYTFQQNKNLALAALSLIIGIIISYLYSGHGL